ncbi:MAG: heme exporter, ATP-binding protein CcmA [Pseudomonadota bacterium]|jgi:heme exporter protein A
MADHPAFSPASGAPAATLELQQLGCARGGRLLFDGVSLRLEAGQWLKVSGDNGAGKTSLLRVLAGLLPPASGQVLWRGHPLVTQAERLGRERLFLGHAPAVKDDLTALENLMAACTLAGEPVPTGEALQALDAAGLRAQAHQPLRRLSQGQRRRCALARLPLARRRPLWILDEPFSALDTPSCDWLGAQVRAHIEQGGMAVLTSHQAVALDRCAHQELRL